jgi:hypothetical protein
VVKKAYETTDFTFDLGWFSNIEVNKNYVKFPEIAGYGKLEGKFVKDKDGKVNFEVGGVLSSLAQTYIGKDLVFTNVLDKTSDKKITINKKDLENLQLIFLEFTQLGVMGYLNKDDYSLA